MKRPSQKRPLRRGFFTLDAIAGIAVVGILIIAMLVAIDRTRRLQNRLADARASTRLCEAALADLAAGKIPPADPRITWRVLDTPATQGQVWVQVSAEFSGVHRTLIGITPRPIENPAGGAP